ncbi:MAG: hypothetical protein ABS873_04275 [Alkalibacterium sp.]
MQAQFTLEWLLFTRNIKNRILFILFLLAVLYYGLIIAPQYRPLYSFTDEEGLTERIEDQQTVIDQYGTDRPRTTESARMIIQFSENQLEALEQEDWQSYFEATINVNREIRISRYGNAVDPRFFDIDEPYPEQEEAFWTRHMRYRYTSYWSDDFEGVTPAVVEERTVLQTLHRLLQESLPFILLIVLVLFSVDSLTRNKGHATLFNSTPIPFGKVLWVKTAVSLSGFFLTLLAGFFVLALTLGPRYGMGSFSIPVLSFSYNLRGSTYESLSLGLWLGQALVLLLLSSLLLIRGILLLSVLFKQELFNLVIGISVLFTESLYYSRGIGYFSDIGLLPPTFFSIGSVLSGYHNFLYNSRDLHFLNGVLSLGAAWLIIEVLILITIQFKRLRKV